MRRSFLLLPALLLSAACGKKKDATTLVQTAPVERRDIIIDAEATGAVEPINVVEVKSKASGQITKGPPETGTVVHPGDLIVQVDTRDVQNQYDQTLANVRAAEERARVTAAQRKRSDELFAQKVITAQEHETTTLDFANAQAALVGARTNLDLAKQRLEDATVRAPVTGTVIEKDVSLGQVIASATGTFGGGTTLIKMADLGQVRIRALVNETDIGQVRPGQVATVTVDAYPDRPFRGIVEKIEPQAVVQQSVTMFPVLVTLDNREGLLKPGMNGEVNVVVDQHLAVLAIPTDAVRSLRETQMAAQILGLNADSVQQQVRAQMAAAMGGGGDAPAATPVPAGNGRTQVARGEVDLQQEGGRQGGAGGMQGGRQLPAVNDSTCNAVNAAMAKQPAVKAQLDSIRQGMQAGTIDFQAARERSQALYQKLGVDPMVARACGRRNGQGGQGAQGQQGAQGMGRTKPGLVFVAGGTEKARTWTPRVVRLGASNYDYIEVVSGLKEGEQVALLAAASLQMQREQSNQRFKNMTSGGMQRQTTGGATGGAGGAGGGGARGGAGRP